MKPSKFLFISFVMAVLMMPSSAGAQNATSDQNYTEEQLNLESKYFTNGNDLFDKGQYQDAIAEYDKALSILPNDTDAMYEKGRALNNLGNFTGAVSYFDRVLAIDPGYTDAMTSKGIALENLGRRSDALSYYDKALSLEPNNTDAMYRKGLTLQNMTQNAEAISYFDKVLAIDPTNTDAMYHKGLVLESMGNHSGAIAYYNQVLQDDPTNTDVLNSRNIALGKQPLEETQGSRLDNTLLTVIGLFVAIVIVILAVDRVMKRRQKHVQVPMVRTPGGYDSVESPKVNSGEHHKRDFDRVIEKTISVQEKPPITKKEIKITEPEHKEVAKTFAPDSDAQSLIVMIRELEKNQIGNSIMLEMTRKALEEGRPINKIEKEYVIKKYNSFKHSQI